MVFLNGNYYYYFKICLLVEWVEQTNFNLCRGLNLLGSPSTHWKIFKYLLQYGKLIKDIWWMKHNFFHIWALNWQKLSIKPRQCQFSSWTYRNWFFLINLYTSYSNETPTHFVDVWKIFHQKIHSWHAFLWSFAVSSSQKFPWKIISINNEVNNFKFFLLPTFLFCQHNTQGSFMLDVWQVISI